MKGDLRREIFLIPNILSAARVVAIPFVLMYIDNESPLRSFIAAIICTACAATDVLDGYLARRSQQVSVLGKFLDPLADKILLMAVLVWMVPLGRIEPWIVVVLLARELAITGLRSVASAHGLVIQAGRLGKHKTALQFIALLALILHFPYPVALTNWWVDFHHVGIYTIYMSMVFSLFSAVEYFQLFARAVEASKASIADSAA